MRDEHGVVSARVGVGPAIGVLDASTATCSTSCGRHGPTQRAAVWQQRHDGARWCWMSTRRWWRSTPRTSSRRRRTIRAASGSIRCSASAMHGEALAGIAASGNAAANSGADQLAVVDVGDRSAARRRRRRSPRGDDRRWFVQRMMVRADTAGHVQAVHRRAGRAATASSRSPPGYRTCWTPRSPRCRRRRWRPAINPDGGPRRGAQIVELDRVAAAGVPAGTRSSCAANDPTKEHSCGCGTTAAGATKCC